MNRPPNPHQPDFWSTDYRPAPPVTDFAGRPSMASTLTQAWRVAHLIHATNPKRGRQVMRLLIQLVAVADCRE